MVKYSTKTYTSRLDYTPCDKVINNKTFLSNIPDSLETELGSIQLFDGEDFIPQLSVYWEFAKNKGEWKHCKKSDFYTHLKTGIKVKLEVIRSHALDYTNPSNGWEKRTLTVKIPQSDGRGTNPNSHHNKKKLMV